MSKKKNKYNNLSLALALVLGINVMYPSVILLMYLTDFMKIHFYSNIIFHQFISSISLIALFYTPPLQLPTFKQVILRKGYIYILFPISAVLIYLAPWHLDRTSNFSTFAAMSRAIWLVFVWSRLQEASNKELKILALLTLSLSLLDGSRSYALLAFLGIVVVYRASILIKLLLILAVPIVLSIVHFIRIFIVELNVEVSLFSILSEGFIGESYWGYYGLAQIERAGNVFFLQDYLSTMLFPIIGFLQYPLGCSVECSWSFLDPNFLARLNVKKQLGEHLYPMAGYLIHTQFITLGPILGNISLYFYLFLIRQFSVLIFGINRTYCHWAIIFIAIKASPEVIMSFCYFLAFYQFVFYSLNMKKIRWV